MRMDLSHFQFPDAHGIMLAEAALNHLSSAIEHTYAKGSRK
jgi:hypothetical protein